MTDTQTEAVVPDFRLPVADGSELSRADLAGSPYVLYFYPKDQTPGCTAEACDFRDNWQRLQARGVRVVGVSRDGAASHEKFVAKHDLPFPLLTDGDHELMDRLGVWDKKTLYGKVHLGVVRTTILADGDHRILRRWDKVKVKGHIDEVLAAVEDLC